MCHGSLKEIWCVWYAGTSSIDTTCTIWGLETGQVLGRVNLVSGHVKTQLIAHDKEVSWLYDTKAGLYSQEGSKSLRINESI